MIQKINNPASYYQHVARHFDEDAQLFEKRFLDNSILNMIRNDFRKHTEYHYFTNALEIGCGPGIDLYYFAEKYPDKNFYAFDVSPGMTGIAQKRISEGTLKNAIVKAGSVEQIHDLFPAISFDMIYVYFGGLNTVVDLKKVVKILREYVSKDATLVLTCVNRYYLLDLLVRSINLKFEEATARFRNKWKGYSPGRDLKSQVYSARFIRQHFEPEFEIIKRKGYSIFYPPWYAVRHLSKLRSLAPMLWKLDQKLQSTFLWNLGEYSLYVMKAK
ncbi:MAG: class I SAM-dependent methyltransferase [Bacteroidetes bacterium]|nr:class I SAM-dependent methyltransferase [Bacteroidota bacterium]